MPTERIRNEPPPPPPTPYRGPNYQGFVFVLVSSSGRANHVLTISTQTNENFFEQAYITGSWYGDDPSQPKAIEGVITGTVPALVAVGRRQTLPDRLLNTARTC
jgi:hypothetical protein